MRVTVIVPVYNMASNDKLTYCLDSLINQTIDDYEIIAVDDCSTDNSPEILKDYATRYPDKVKLLYNERNLHQGGAKNRALKVAHGEWISFIDADDWIVPDYYERMLAKAEESGADCVGCDYVMVHEHKMSYDSSDIVDSNSRPDQVGKLDDDKRRSLILDGGSLCVKLFRREMVEANELSFPEDIFYEDNAMGNSYMLLNKHYEYIPEPLYFYYQHGESTVHTITTKRCEDRMTAERYMLKEANRHGFIDKYRDEIEFNFTMMFYVNTLFSYMPGVKRTSISWVDALSSEMKLTFPKFRENKYYQMRLNSEEKKLIDMAMKSTLQFVIYYKLLWGYRNLRKRLGGNNVKR